ncbi:CHAT domain-containing protein [Fibrella sp. WM1]|uniref:CHAT domain-containing protein n=1 Tax=Fibrella musci TaxID=3242485 RepID=UPI003520B2CB
MLRYTFIAGCLLGCLLTTAATGQARKPHYWETLMDNVDTDYAAGAYTAALSTAQQISHYESVEARHDTAMLHRIGRLMVGAILCQTGQGKQADVQYRSVLDEFWRDTALNEQRQQRVYSPFENPPSFFWENQPVPNKLRLLTWYDRWAEALISHDELGRAESLLNQSQFWNNLFTTDAIADGQWSILTSLATFFRTTLQDAALYREVRQVQQQSQQPGMPTSIKSLIYKQYLDQFDQLDTSSAEVRRILTVLQEFRREAFDQSPLLQMIRHGLRQQVEFHEHVGQWDRAVPPARAYYNLWYIGSRTNQHEATNKALHGWVRCLAQQGNFATSDSLLRVARQAIAPTHPDRAAQLARLANSRGVWYYEQGKTSAALAQFDSALTYLRTYAQPDTAASTHTLSSLLSLSTGQPSRFAAAEQYHTELRRFGVNARADGLLARVRLTQKRYPEAIRLLQPLVDQVRTRPDENRAMAAGWLRTYALAQYASQPNKGREVIREAGQRLAAHITQLTSTLPQAVNESLLQLLTHDIDALQAACIETQATDALFDLLLAIRNQQVDPLRAVNQRISKTDSTSHRYYLAYRQWQNQLATYQHITGRSPLGTLVQARADQAEIELRRQVSGTTSVLHWTDVQKALKARDAVVEFVTYRPSRSDSVWYYALVLRPSDNQPQLVRLFEQEQLKQWLPQGGAPSADVLERLYRGGVSGGKVATPPDSLRLYRLLWQPIDSLLTHTHTVYLVPTGLLHNLSFAAIRRPDGTLLIDGFTLRYRLSSRLLVTPEPFRLPKRSAILLAGGINYTINQSSYNANQQQQDFLKSQFLRVISVGSNLSGVDTVALNVYGHQLDSLRLVREAWQRNATSQDGFWKSLPGTQTEVDTLTYLLGRRNHRSVRLTGPVADEWRFRQVADSLRPQVIHLATHGYFTPPLTVTTDSLAQGQWHNPLMRAGLAMAGANFGRQYPNEAGNNDGVLSALDVSTLNLTNTQLAVLSACETGLGEERGSEGVFGLQRALKLAGVNYIVQSLWRIPDAETVSLMTVFYERLLAGDEIEDAFATAQSQLRKRYTPYYWAAFVLIR